MALSKNTMGLINFTAMLLSIPIIGSGIWISTQQDNSCVNILQWPVIILGILILAASLSGFIGAFWRITWLFIVYLISMLLLIILLACLVVYVYLITVKGSGHVEPNRVYLEYNLQDFSGWLRKNVESSYKWDKVRSCLSSASTCSELNQRFKLAQDFFNAPITPLQSGCCKPPTECGYTFVNPTYWISPINGGADPDCSEWSNDQTQLCYSCTSCKAGLLANLKREWRRAGLVLLFALVALISIYFVGCCAFRTIKNEELFDKYKQGVQCN